MTLTADVRLRRGPLDIRADLEAAPGEVTAVLGPNGSGKSTLLAAIAGLLPIDRGRIALDGEVFDDPANGVRRATERRRVGVVFQDLLLFEHLDVRDNVAFGPRSAGRSRREARERAQRHLEDIGIAHVARRRPAELSGGEAQLVALARALATGPALLLLDEPLAALDVETRRRVRQVLAEHLASFRGPTVLVTHEPLEAIALADRLVIIEAGRITQRGPVAEVARRPRSPWVAALVGLNLYRGRARAGVIHLDATTIVPAEQAQGEVFAVIHPRAVAVHRRRPEGSPRNVWRGEAAGLDVHGDRARLEVAGPLRIVAEVTPAAVSELDLARGGDVWVSVKATEVDVYPV